MRGHPSEATRDRPARPVFLPAGVDARAPAREADDARQLPLDASPQHLRHAVSVPPPAAAARGRRARLPRAFRPARALSPASLARTAVATVPIEALLAGP